MSSELGAWEFYKERKVRKFLEKALSTLLSVVEEETDNSTLIKKLQGLKESIIAKAIKELP